MMVDNIEIAETQLIISGVLDIEFSLLVKHLSQISIYDGLDLEFKIEAAQIPLFFTYNTRLDYHDQYFAVMSEFFVFIEITWDLQSEFVSVKLLE